VLRINISATCCYALLLPQDGASAAFRLDFIFSASGLVAVVVVVAIVVLLHRKKLQNQMYLKDKMSSCL